MTSSSRPISTSTLTSAYACPHADRGIEDYGTLQNLIDKPGVYRRLMDRFHAADDRYNSGLFDFRKDTVTPSLKIDDKLLSDILSELYPPKSPYEFSVIGIEILGEVYEQLLGKVIRLTAGHQAKVEQEPEGHLPARAFGLPGPILHNVRVEDEPSALTETK